MTIPAELLRSVPRDTALTAAGKVVVALIAVFFLAAALGSATLFAIALRASDRPVGIQRHRAPLVAAPVALTSAGAAGLGLLLTIRRQRRLLSDGQASIARITSSTTKKRGTHSTQTLHSGAYEFQLRRGGVRTGRFQMHEPAPIGGEFVVLYDPDQPERSVKYPLPLVRCARSA
jgi:hypothetical protein